MMLNQFIFEMGKYIFVVFDGINMMLINKLFKNSKYLVRIYGLNPLFVYLTFRGSCESINCFLMLIFIYFLKKKQTFYCGIIYGVWIHFRVYPIIFGLSFFIYFLRKNIKMSIKFSLGSLIGFGILFGYFYNKYGNEFI